MPVDEKALEAAGKAIFDQGKGIDDAASWADAGLEMREWLKGHARAAILAYEAAKPAPAGAVAWRWRTKSPESLPWSLSSERSEASHLEIQPLYAHPAPEAGEPFSLLSQMAYIAAYDPDELDGGASPEGQRAAQRLRAIIERARRAAPAPAGEEA